MTGGADISRGTARRETLGLAAHGRAGVNVSAFRRWAVVAALVAAAMLAAGVTQAQARPASAGHDWRPNILVVITDDEAQADVAHAKAQVMDAEIELGYCRMFSPIDGRISLARVKPGNLVGPASYVRERIAAFAEAGVTNLQLIPATDDPAATVAEVKEWVS